MEKTGGKPRDRLIGMATLHQALEETRGKDIRTASLSDNVRLNPWTALRGNEEGNEALYKFVKKTSIVSWRQN